LLGLAALEMA